MRELKEEQEANAFALALLMPLDLLVQEIDAYKKKHNSFTRDQMVEFLCGKFQVSKIAMLSRLYNLGFINQL